EELSKLFAANGALKDQATSGKIRLRDVIQKKKDAHQKMVASTLVSAERIEAKAYGEIRNSLHVARRVVVQTRDQDKKEDKEEKCILKTEVETRIAGLEVFSGTMMELYIGPHQP